MRDIYDLFPLVYAIGLTVAALIFTIGLVHVLRWVLV